VRILECGQQLRLALEPRQPFGIPRHFDGQHLDGHVALQSRVVGSVHLAHATGAEAARDLVVAQFGWRRLFRRGVFDRHDRRIVHGPPRRIRNRD